MGENLEVIWMEKWTIDFSYSFLVIYNKLLTRDHVRSVWQAAAYAVFNIQHQL